MATELLHKPPVEDMETDAGWLNGLLNIANFLNSPTTAHFYLRNDSKPTGVDVEAVKTYIDTAK